jgi:hypothetical protein
MMKQTTDVIKDLFEYKMWIEKNVQRERIGRVKVSWSQQVKYRLQY